MRKQVDRAVKARNGTVPSLDELIALTDGLLSSSGQRSLQDARQRVADDRFNLVVLGEFKRGKSTLLNALLRRRLLPTGVVPLTSVVTVIASGESERLVVKYADGREQERPLEELGDYVTEARNPRNERGVERVRVELDHTLLDGGLELVDTPGIGSIYSHNTAAARGFLPNVDAALCVLDIGQPLSQSERDLFVEVARRVPRLLIVVNKIDHVAPEDRDVAVAFMCAALDELLPETQRELFAVSARTRDGIDRLVRRVRRLAQDERENLLLRSVAGLAAGSAADGAQAARFQAHAIELPLDDLNRRARHFDERIGELRLTSAESRDLLDQGVTRALDETVSEPLNDHARREQSRLHAAFRKHVEEAGRCTPRELANDLERWIDQIVRADFEELVPRFEKAIADQLTELERRYATRVAQVLEDVQHAAEDAFGASSGELLPRAGLRQPSRFTFKLEDVEHALDILVGWGRTITPGALGRRLVVLAAEQRLMEMTDRHAGRLRSELTDRVSTAVREYERQLETTIEEAIESIQAAVQRAVEKRRRGDERARDQLRELRDLAERCDLLCAEFRALAGPTHETPLTPGS